MNTALVPELTVTDFQKSLDFYTRILGFLIKYKRPEEGFAYLYLDNAELMIDESGKGRTWKTGEFEYPLGRGINIEIHVENIDPLLRNLESNDVQLFMEPEEKWYRKDNVEIGNLQFLVQDPDGYLLRFAQSLGERKYNE